MTDKIALEVVTPERRVLAVDVDEVVLPSVNGYLGVLPGHAPLLSMLDVGEVSYRVGNERHYLTVSGGYAEILRHAVSILAPTSEKAEEIDVERAELAKRGAEKLLKESSGSEFNRADIRLRKALARIQVHGRLGG